MKIITTSAALLLAFLSTSAACASSPAAWAAADKAMRAACTRAAGLTQPTLSPIVLFSDTMGKSALLVSGRWPQAHMKGKRATMLCLYDRRTRLAETSEALGWQAPPK